MASAIIEKEPEPISNIKPMTPPALTTPFGDVLRKIRKNAGRQRAMLSWSCSGLGNQDRSQAHR